MNKLTMQITGSLTFLGFCADVSLLPKDAEPGDVFAVSEESYIFSEEGAWTLMEGPTLATVSIVEQTLSKFEGVTVMLRIPSYDRIESVYPYVYPVQDCEPVGVLRKRIEAVWPGCDFEIMDGRSIWDHTHCMTMGQLRNSYLMSRSPE